MAIRYNESHRNAEYWTGEQCNESLVWKSVDIDQYRFDSNHSGASRWPQP
jgi:hypothetical protein